MDKDELVQEIGAMLLHDPKISARPWQHLAIVAQIMPNSTKVNGFLYQDSGKAIPTSPGNFDVLKRFKELREAMQEPNKDQWKACLVRINASSRKISIDFEYDQPEKWQIDPSTVKKMADVLRPEP